MTMSATAAPTDSEEATLLTQIANQTDVDESDINNFDITYSPSTRRRTRQLLSGTWDVSFDITISLASTSESTASAFETSVVSALSDTGFQSSVASVITSITSFDSISSTIVTRTPTPAPTLPTLDKSNGGSGSTSNASLTYIIIAVVAIVLFGVGGVLFYLKSHSDSFEDILDPRVEKQPEVVHYENFNSSKSLIQKRKEEELNKKSLNNNRNISKITPSSFSSSTKPIGIRIEMM
jgi:hypothetical protein